MNYFLYQLQFNTPVHFGASDSALSLYSSEDHFRADTLFSALCHTALQLQGADGLNRLLTLASSGSLLLSDAMPWQGDRFFLPKPYYTAQASLELPSEKRKAMKKLAWIPADGFEGYCASVKTGVLYEAQAVSFGISAESTKACVRETEDTLPYPVGLYRFREDCGLYVIMACGEMADSEWLLHLTEALGSTGIGGKVSAGYGKFSIADEIYLNEFFDGQTEWLYAALTREAGAYMLLTTSLPDDKELDAALDGAFYQLTRRAGFVASDTYAQMPRKKQTQYFLSAGSVLKRRFSGGLYQIGDSGAHPVYRFSRPVFLGVSL